MLVKVTNVVGILVLGNNYKQIQVLSLAQRRVCERIAKYKRLMGDFEAHGKLDRAPEFPPFDEELAERVNAGQGLARAELSVLTSYSKIDLKGSLLKSLVLDDDYLTCNMGIAFPALLAERFNDAIHRRHLKHEIASTQIANDLVNYMGITFV